MDLLCFPEPPCLRLAPTFGNKTTKVGLRSPGREEENKAIPALLKHKRKPYPEVGAGVLQKMGARCPLGKEAVLMSLREDGAAPCCRTPIIQESYKPRRVIFPLCLLQEKKINDSSSPSFSTGHSWRSPWPTWVRSHQQGSLSGRSRSRPVIPSQVHVQL